MLNGIRTAGVFTGAFTARFTIKRVLKSTCQPTQYTTIYNILRCVCVSCPSPPHPRLLRRTVMVFYYLLFFRVFILGRLRIISPQHCGRRTLVSIRAYRRTTSLIIYSLLRYIRNPLVEMANG